MYLFVVYISIVENYFLFWQYLNKVLEYSIVDNYFMSKGTSKYSEKKQDDVIRMLENIPSQIQLSISQAKTMARVKFDWQMELLKLSKENHAIEKITSQTQATPIVESDDSNINDNFGSFGSEDMDNEDDEENDEEIEEIIESGGDSS